MLKTWFEIPLWQRVVTALILGVLTGWAWGPDAESIKWIGDFFIKAIKMLVVPLIFFSLVSGVAAIGDLRKLGAVGGRALLLFVVTGQIAVWLGLGLGTLIQPGAGVDTSAIQMGETPVPNETTAVDMVLSIVPESPVQVMADVAVLPLIVFSLLIGIGILMAKEEGLPVQKVFDSGAVIMQKVTMIVMELTPFGVFALMAWVAGTLGLDALVSLAKLVGLNYLGCLLIIVLIYGSMIKFLARLPVRDFFRGIVDAMAVSYSTASSNATLPVTLRCAERNLGVSNSVASFVIALGATINMNGTAMYLGLATLFGAQIFGVDLSMGDYFLISILA
ncbi:dicarboxylate/amino acid:cation symporter, partial [Erythrobacter sp. HI0074]